VSRIKVDAIQGTSGSDTAITLSGANATVGGTLAVTGVHTVGNNAIYTSEGGAVTQNTVQGLVKCWFQITQDTTHSINDSFNVGSITDAGAGETAVNYSNVMANSDWSGVLTAQTSNNRRAVNNGPNTTRIKVEVYQVSSNTTPSDATNGVSGTVHGDLA